jgi:hypothetical protein
MVIAEGRPVLPWQCHWQHLLSTIEFMWLSEWLNLSRALQGEVLEERLNFSDFTAEVQLSQLW